MPHGKVPKKLQQKVLGAGIFYSVLPLTALNDHDREVLVIIMQGRPLLL